MLHRCRQFVPRGLWLSPSNERDPWPSLESETLGQATVSDKEKGGGGSQVRMAHMCRAISVLQWGSTEASDDESRGIGLKDLMVRMLLCKWVAEGGTWSNRISAWSGEAVTASWTYCPSGTENVLSLKRHTHRKGSPRVVCQTIAGDRF